MPFPTRFIILPILVAGSCYSNGSNNHKWESLLCLSISSRYLLAMFKIFSFSSALSVSRFNFYLLFNVMKFFRSSGINHCWNSETANLRAFILASSFCLSSLKLMRLSWEIYLSRSSSTVELIEGLLTGFSVFLIYWRYLIELCSISSLSAFCFFKCFIWFSRSLMYRFLRWRAFLADSRFFSSLRFILSTGVKRNGTLWVSLFDFLFSPE